MPKHNKHNRGANGHGGSCWIRREKRLAIYLRDGLSCCWCGLTIEDGITLTIDHVIPRSCRGSNDTRNLISACLKCNANRADLSVSAFADVMADWFHGEISRVEIVAHVFRQAAKPLDLNGARDLIRRRGGYTPAMQSLAKSA